MGEAGHELDLRMANITSISCLEFRIMNQNDAVINVVPNILGSSEKPVSVRLEGSVSIFLRIRSNILTVTWNNGNVFVL